MEKTHRLSVIVVLLFVVSPMAIMPLGTMIPRDVIVTMNNDSSVIDSVKTIQSNVDDVIVVEQGSIEYALMIHRIVGAVVWASHGSEDGILSTNGIMSWSSFSTLLETTKGMDVVLACDSAQVYDFVSQDRVIAFGGAIDAVLGGLFASWLLTGAREILSSAADRAMALVEGSVVSNNLYWSTEEQGWFAIDAALFMLNAVFLTFGLYFYSLAASATMAVFAGLQFMAVFLSFSIFMCGACSGALSPITVATKLLSAMASVFAALLGRVPWYISIIATGECILTGWTKLLNLVIMIIGLVTLVSNMFNDQVDPDGIYGRWYIGM